MSSLEEFHPHLRSSELFFYNDKIILKSKSAQVILPVQALHFLIYFNGQYNLRDIIERNYAYQKPFTSVSLYDLSFKSTKRTS